MNGGLPVLLGGRSELRSRGVSIHIAIVWLPVVVMLLVIARESTASFGSMQTSEVLRPMYEAVFGRVRDDSWAAIHHYLRKTGHFVGYGTLGLTWLRAFLLTWVALFRAQAAGVWRRWSFQMAICCTALVASLDELHQSYLPDRTGMMTDVLLDTVGALTLCGAVWLIWMWRDARQNSLAGPQA